MTIAKLIIEKELQRNGRMISEYEDALAKLPKGKLTVKKINCRSYFYLKYRNGEKVVTEYIGKDNCDVSELNIKLEKRKHIELMLKQLKSERKELEKLGSMI